MTGQSMTTHRYLRYVLSHTGTDEDFHYIDLAKGLSEINRRLYRQGRMYHVANINVHDSQGDAYVKFCTAPHTWPAREAWKMGFRKWKQQRAEALAGISTDATGKWSDFKVYLNNDHRTDVDTPRPTDVENDPIDEGEWAMSKFYFDVDDNGVADEAEIHMMGPNNGDVTLGTLESVSLMNSFYQILHQPQEDPKLPESFNTGVYANLFDGAPSPDEILDDIEDDNDLPPYKPTNFGGVQGSMQAPWEIREVHLSTGANATAMVGGFQVPLGLLCVETKSSTDDNEIGILIELAPGSYQGIMAEEYV